MAAAIQQICDKRIIWQGILEWHELPSKSKEQQTIIRQIPCQVMASVNAGEPEVRAENWPAKLVMQLIPSVSIGATGINYMRSSKSVIFSLQTCAAMDLLTHALYGGLVGIVHFTSIACDVKVLHLAYSKGKHAYLGFIPNNQEGYFAYVTKIIQQQKNTHSKNQQRGSSTRTPQQNVREKSGMLSASRMTMSVQSSNPWDMAMSQQEQQLHKSAPGQQDCERHVIWQGILEWNERKSVELHKIIRQVPCQVLVSVKAGEPELKTENWPEKLAMQLIPKTLIGTIGSMYVHNSRAGQLNVQPCEAIDSLKHIMDRGFVGCVNVTGCDIRVFILLHSKIKRSFFCFIPHDQGGFVDRLQKAILEYRTVHNKQAVMHQKGMSQNLGEVSVMPSASGIAVSAVASSPQSSLMSQQPIQLHMETKQRERHVIWEGILEWQEMPQSEERCKITRQLPCQVMASVNTGEPELKAENWPAKLTVLLISKALVGRCDTSYFGNSKWGLFNMQKCEALDLLTDVMDSGFAGCVYFTSSACNMKVMIIFYSKEKHTYLGFIPNDQGGFVDNLQAMIQQQGNQGAVIPKMGDCTGT